MNKFPIKIISTQEQSVLQIRFFPTDICNFNCSYCFPGSHDNKYRYPKDVDLLIVNFRKLFDAYKDKTKFHLMIAGGGEPTMWPSLDVFCREIKKHHNVTITIVTNGSRTIRWWQDNLSTFDDIVLSCHHEEVKLDHFINVADLMFGAGVNVTALMLMSAKHWDKCVSYIEQMRQSKHKWFIEAKPIVDAPGQGMDVYTQDQLNYIDDSIKRLPESEYLLGRMSDMRTHQSVVLFNDDSVALAKPSTIIVNKWNNFKNWKCNVGIESLAIPASGKIFTSCGVNIINEASNIFDENFSVNEFPKIVTCPFNECSCQTDTHVTKIKDE